MCVQRTLINTIHWFNTKKNLPQSLLMTAPFKGPFQNEPKPEIGIQQEMESWPYGNLCAALWATQKQQQKDDLFMGCIDAGVAVASNWSK